VTKRERFIQWVQVGMVTLEPDGSALGPMGIVFSAADVATIMDAPFTVSRRHFYGVMGGSPQVQSLARWADRIHSAEVESHDPGDEDRT
jgi:hypothetical protein